MAANGAQEGLVSSNGTRPARSSPDELIERVQRLTAALDEVSDPAARSHAEDLVSAVIELYGEGLERIFAVVDSEPDAGPLRERLQDDGVIASLMLIHDLYPVSLEDRVVEALDSVRPYMESHGGDVELLGVEQGIARIRLEGSCKTCPASQSTLELAIKSALDEAAPDLEGLVVEGPASPAAAARQRRRDGAAGDPGRSQPRPVREPAWFALPAVEALAEGELTGAEIENVSLVVGRVEGNLLAFHDRCPSCSAELNGAELVEGTLTCPGCERRYFLPRAGRSLDDERLLLEPVPLLEGVERAQGRARRRVSDPLDAKGRGAPPGRPRLEPAPVLAPRCRRGQRRALVAPTTINAANGGGRAAQRSQRARGALRSLRQRHPRRSSPHAAAGRAPDSLHV